jgi:hypothetical protein
MMHVKVNNRNFLNFVSILALKISRCDSNIIDETKAVRTCLSLVIPMESLTENAGMVTWRSRRTKCIPKLPTHNLITSFDHCPASQQCRIP